ncbi:MAG: DegT/DnrJ/EryC1/StrS family aminotransferase [Spirochaetota bacterium]|jgi:dTDP-4-amino-4,6-dideoxygalactose transaminase|nr:DegT/DnrJ/EryC1/StrS family aminotransferase [Spirochaetota bacterium]
MEKIIVPLCRPDIDESDIARVVETLRSGWITTGLRVREFEQALAAWLGVSHVVCLNSATAGMELVLRVLGVGVGDEVITTIYTYAATANIIRHLGARAVLVDTLRDDFAIDPDAVARALGPRTKAIIPVDFAGWPCDYTALAALVRSARSGFSPTAANPWQEKIGRPVILADAAHSLGSRYAGERVPLGADFAVYSFHAVKNLTTAEGGAVAYRSHSFGSAADADAFARQLRLMALHGQSKDALAKLDAANWEYDIEMCGYKHNMTDMQAALGIGQLARYDAQLARRRTLAERYHQELRGARCIHPAWLESAGGARASDVPRHESSYHLYPLRLEGYGLPERNDLIARLAEDGIAANVHFKPLPLFTAYRDEYSIANYPNGYAHYVHEITLPLWPGMSERQMDWVIARVNALAR